MTSTIAEDFAEYLEVAYPGETIEGVQLTEVRRGFYAGAWLVLSAIHPDSLATWQRTMVRECLQFNEDVKAGIK